MANVPVALQLYTVRNELEKDFEGTIEQIAKIGYAGVEFSGFAGKTTGKAWRVVSEFDLKVAGCHFPLDQLEKDIESVCEMCLELCCEYIVVPSLPEERRRDRKRWREAANSMNEIAQDIQDYDLKLCYHNHAYEFEKVGNELAWDIFFDAADPDLVGAEIDTYWIQYAGLDPVEYIRNMSKRCPLIHLHDMAGDEKKSSVEVGRGILQWDGIFQAAEDGGVKWYIVEQNECTGSAIESARISFENLKARGKV